MTDSFSPDATRLIVSVLVTGPRRGHRFDMTLDTGSALTVLPAMFLRQLGCEKSHPVGHTRLRTATGIARAPLVRLPAVSALGHVRTDLLVAAHDFPLGVEADGLLGLDFFRELILTLDFTRGRITLAPPKRWWRFWR